MTYKHGHKEPSEASNISSYFVEKHSKWQEMTSSNPNIKLEELPPECKRLSIN